METSGIIAFHWQAFFQLFDFEYDLRRWMFFVFFSVHRKLPGFLNPFHLRTEIRVYAHKGMRLSEMSGLLQNQAHHPFRVLTHSWRSTGPTLSAILFPCLDFIPACSPPVTTVNVRTTAIDWPHSLQSLTFMHVPLVAMVCACLSVCFFFFVC